jgi:hypothetical protein
VDAIWGLLNVHLELIEEFFDLRLKLLALWRSLEFLIENMKLMGLLGLSQFFEGHSNSLNWSRVLNLLPGFLNIVELGLDGIGTSFVDLNLEEVSVVLPVLWNIRDLDVLLESSIELLELLLKHVPLLGL